MADIFTDDELKADEATALTEGPAEETAEQKEQRERVEKGRFVAKEAGEEAPIVEDAAVVEEGKEKGGTVPQGALHAERERRKAAETELTTLREQLGAIQKMREQVASRTPEALPAADDPAALDHLRNRLAEVEQATTSITRDRDTAALNQQEMQQLGAFMHQSETAFRSQQPDYDDAINHVVQARAGELQLYGLSPAQIAQTISEEATEIVRSAVAQGRDPAELGYQIAKSRGYMPKATEQAAPTKQNGSGGAQAVLDAIANAQSKSKSLGSGGGSAVKTLSIEAINQLSPEEFDAIYSTPDGKRMIDGL